eukprot:TRINITY_DN111406_c0_g1_i1.p1 TRINITY_DN111406_c0_g1~~TRINITY_DN111406_c0_g1_i1.p1  ORF type:complete len:532 (-),score=114.95 TRINITY_DN111406_c0_g1_i1:106-1701(-)
MPVQFKFRGERTFRSLLNVTTPCTLQRVKNAIYEQARISDQSTDLALEDASGDSLSSGALLIADALVQIVVRRTPMQSRAAPMVSLAAAVPVDEVASREEELAIDRIVEAHDIGAIVPASSSSAGVAKYSRSHRLAVDAQSGRQKEGYDLGGSDDDGEAVEEVREAPPANYTCHRCGMTGGKPESHWIWECPTNEDPDHMRKVRRATGVPRQFLEKVATIEEGQEKSAGGVTFTLPGHSGHYIIAHQNATLEEKKIRVGDTLKEKVTTAFTEGASKVAGSLKCPLCNQLFRQAVLAPCCGATFCSDCVVDRLAHTSVEHGRCPSCRKELLAHQLIGNEDIRRQVEQIARASKAAAVAREKVEEAKAEFFQVDAGLKDRVNRPQKAAEDDATGLLALTDGKNDAKTGSTASATPWKDPRWQPLGFNGAQPLTPDEFLAWQKAVRAGISPSAKVNFEEWQKKMRPMPAIMPPSSSPAPAPASLRAPAPGMTKESFEEWQRALREQKREIVGASKPGKEKRARVSSVVISAADL